MRDYVWHPHEPASGDVRTHGIYSFGEVIRSIEEYATVPAAAGRYCSARLWAKSLEYEAGYRSQFGKVVSLYIDYGDPELLDKFRKIYRVNQVARAGQ